MQISHGPSRRPREAVAADSLQTVVLRIDNFDGQIFWKGGDDYTIPDDNFKYHNHFEKSYYLKVVPIS